MAGVGSTKYSRIPTPDEIASFKGAHCGALYAWALRTEWKCPSCGRSPGQLIRWTKVQGPAALNADEHGMGFTITLTKHHCHGGVRFGTTLICGDCNSADGTAKRKLGLPASWSFTPSEIGRFVSVAPHSGATKIDYGVARQIYDQAVAQSAPKFWLP